MNKPFKREIIVTKDGSKTLFIPELNEQYHSVNGAIQESMHVFIRTGLDQFRHLNSVKIFEVGFGTGLNALLTYQAANSKKIFYHGIEKYPLEPAEIDDLAYHELLNEAELLKNTFHKLHIAKWSVETEIEAGFTLLKDEVALNDFKAKQSYNLIYFDAFAPEIQPDLWTVEVFEKMYDLLENGGVLVTYCAKGQVRRNMQTVGFNVERLPGPPGKREILRAVKA